jgi:hypothetical protein
MATFYATGPVRITVAGQTYAARSVEEAVNGWVAALYAMTVHTTTTVVAAPRQVDGKPVGG